MAELYSRIFVKFTGALQDLFKIVASSTPGNHGRSSIVAQPYVLDLARNPYQSGLEGSDSGDFLQYPYTLEVFADSKDVSLEEYLGFVGRLMTALHGKGMDLVVACDWEARLPGGGKLMQEG